MSLKSYVNLLITAMYFNFFKLIMFRGKTKQELVLQRIGPF